VQPAEETLCVNQKEIRKKVSYMNHLKINHTEATLFAQKKLMDFFNKLASWSVSKKTMNIVQLNGSLPQYTLVFPLQISMKCTLTLLFYVHSILNITAEENLLLLES
jgi:hypothetical protein